MSFFIFTMRFPVLHSFTDIVFNYPRSRRTCLNACAFSAFPEKPVQSAQLYKGRHFALAPDLKFFKRKTQ